MDNSNDLSDIDNRRLNIIHLEDNKLFREGLEDCLLKKFPKINIEGFANSNDALGFIHKCFQSNARIDLIITDFNHLGENGLIFANKVRELEKDFDNHTPIVLFTMVSGMGILDMAVDTGIFNGYYSKSTSCEKVIDFVKNLAIIQPF